MQTARQLWSKPEVHWHCANKLLKAQPVVSVAVGVEKESAMLLHVARLVLLLLRAALLGSALGGGGEAGREHVEIVGRPARDARARWELARSRI